MRREDGAFCLEDLDDKVELDLSDCVSSDWPTSAPRVSLQC